MIDIRLIRENPQAYRDAAERKNFGVDIDHLLDLDRRLRKSRSELQELATAKNRTGKEIPRLKDEAKQQAIAEMTRLKEREKALQTEQQELEPRFDHLLLLVPQPAADDVPTGQDETENEELRRWGEPPTFDFKPRDHVELGELLDIIDIERGVKLAGTRSYFLKGAAARLHWAVLRFAMDTMVVRGYMPLSPPVIVRDEAMRGTGYFPGGEDQAYRIGSDELNLVGTAEVPVTAYHLGEILDEKQLPRKYTALSACFRREAGTYGKDTRGLFRIHQFEKVEQVVVCRADEDESKQFHEEILANAEAVVQALGLPYRVMNVCTGDLGRGQIKKYDIECWMPSRESYGETHSASRFGDFQARRLNLRYRDGQGKVHFCHTLNNTVIASPRILIPLLELNQQQDGSIVIPEALRSYLGGQERITPKAGSPRNT